LASIPESGNRQFGGGHFDLATFFGFFFSCVCGTNTFFAFGWEKSPVQPLVLPKASGGEEDTGDDESGMLGLDFTIVWGSRQGN
jgi:hypothetical protein